MKFTGAAEKLYLGVSVVFGQTAVFYYWKNNFCTLSKNFSCMVPWAFRPPWGGRRAARELMPRRHHTFLLLTFFLCPQALLYTIYCILFLFLGFLFLLHSFRRGLQVVCEQWGLFGHPSDQALCQDLAVPGISRVSWLVWGRAGVPVLLQSWECCWNERGLKESQLKLDALLAGRRVHQIQCAALL